MAKRRASSEGLQVDTPRLAALVLNQTYNVAYFGKHTESRLYGCLSALFTSVHSQNPVQIGHCHILL